MESVKQLSMKKLQIDWKKINEFLNMSGVERSAATGIPIETWSRIKNTDRFPPPRRIQEMAPCFGLSESDMHIAILMLKKAANANANAA